MGTILTEYFPVKEDFILSRVVRIKKRSSQLGLESYSMLLMTSASLGK